jgi:hypothetical protein
MTMRTRTYLKESGLAVLQGVIAGRLQFAETGSYVASIYQTTDERLVEIARDLYTKEPVTNTALIPAIAAAHYLLILQGSEDQWRYDLRLRQALNSTEGYVEIAVTKAREKKERLSDIRCVLAEFLRGEIDKPSMKYACALLGESYMLEDDFECAFFWLKLAHAGPYGSTQHMLDKSAARVAENRERGLEPQIRSSSEGYRYRPLKRAEREERRRKNAAKRAQ